MEPSTAHGIVTEYLHVLERTNSEAFPASVRLLPYPKQTLQSAILTCVEALSTSAQLTDDTAALLEEAYVALADYIDDELVRVMAEYRASLESIAGVQTAKDRVQTPAWARLNDTSRLAGDIAKRIAEDSAVLRDQFRTSASMVRQEGRTPT